jgi:hypothetical protein
LSNSTDHRSKLFLLVLALCLGAGALFLLQDDLHDGGEFAQASQGRVETSPSGLPSSDATAALAPAPSSVGSATSTGPETSSLEPSAEPTSSELQAATPKRALDGQVTRLGQPVTGARVVLRLYPYVRDGPRYVKVSPTPQEYELWTDGQGAFSFNHASALGGELHVSAEVTLAGEKWGAKKLVPLHISEQSRCELELERWQTLEIELSGVVEEAELVLWELGPEPQQDLRDPQFLQEIELERGATHLVVERLPTGRVLASLRGKQGGRRVFGLKAVELPTTSRVRLEVQAAARLRVKFRKDSGLAPIVYAAIRSANYDVTPWDLTELTRHVIEPENDPDQDPDGPDNEAPNDPVGFEYVESRGEILFEVPPVPLRLLAVARDVARIDHAFELQPGQDREITLTFSPGLEASLGLPLVAKSLTFNLWGPPGFTTRVEGQALVFAGLAPEDRVWVVAEGEGGLCAWHEIQAGRRETLKLSPSGKVLATLEGDEGDFDLQVIPLPDPRPRARRYSGLLRVDLDLEEPEGGYVEESDDRALCDYFDISGAGAEDQPEELPPGRYRLWRRGRKPVDFEVRSGEVTRLELGDAERDGR